MNLQPALKAAPTTLPAMQGKPAQGGVQQNMQQAQTAMAQPPVQSQYQQMPARSAYRGPAAQPGQARPAPRGRAWNPSQGTPPPMWNPMAPAMQGQPSTNYQPGKTGRPPTLPPSWQGAGMPLPARPNPNNPSVGNPNRPGRMQPQGPGQRLNWQQRQMQSMPPGMRQMYNGRPMTKTAPDMNYNPSMTMRGQPVGSRVNLQRNQFPRAGAYNSNYMRRR